MSFCESMTLAAYRVATCGNRGHTAGRHQAREAGVLGVCGPVTLIWRAIHVSMHQPPSGDYPPQPGRACYVLLACARWLHFDRETSTG